MADDTRRSEEDQDQEYDRLLNPRMLAVVPTDLDDILDGLVES